MYVIFSRTFNVNENDIEAYFFKYVHKMIVNLPESTLKKNPSAFNSIGATIKSTVCSTNLF